MRNLIRLISLALICLGTGCVIQERPAARYEPVRTAPPPPAPVVIVTPQPFPRPAPTVVVRTPAAPPREPWVSVAITAQEHQAVQQHLNSYEPEHPQGKE